MLYKQQLLWVLRTRTEHYLLSPNHKVDWDKVNTKAAKEIVLSDVSVCEYV